MSDIHEAVSAVIVCGTEIFVIQRQFHLRAFPGYLAFPGGKVDAEDYEGQGIEGLELPVVEQFALRRELIEELSWDWFDDWGNGNVDSVDKVASALAPPGVQIRFNNHFYRITLNKKPIFSADIGEIFWSEWLQPSKVLQHFQSGEFVMVSPTRELIKALAKDLSVPKVDFSGIRPSMEKLPVIEVIHALKMILVPSNTLPPASNTTALYLGDEGQQRLLVDPSPKNQEALKVLLTTLEELPVTAILISHHHPDHHEHSVDVARALNVPMLMSRLTRHNIQQKFGETYFSGVSVQLLQEGDEVTRWRGEPVMVHELPGHDDGMLGFAPKSLNWMFVADLVQPGTTVVIPEDVGDMKIYCETLERVIALSPKAVIPSHGGVQVGPRILEKTLEHRLTRESQILEQWQQGQRDEKAIMDAIYPPLPLKVQELAKQNIRQHLKKLLAEKSIESVEV